MPRVDVRAEWTLGATTLIHAVDGGHNDCGAGLATKIAVSPEDDLDGAPAEETVRIGLGSAEYEIDVSKQNTEPSAGPQSP